jgi:hypothetical protein
MEGGCRWFLVISMLTSALPGQASAISPAARWTSASSKCTMAGPALALLNAPRGLQSSGDEGDTANKTTSTGTVTEGQPSP